MTSRIVRLFETGSPLCINNLSSFCLGVNVALDCSKESVVVRIERITNFELSFLLALRAARSLDGL